MKFLIVLVVLVSVSYSQYLPELSGSELRKILKSDDMSKNAVNCILNFTPDCNPRLARAHEVAPEIFRNGGKCKSCSDNDAKVLHNFLGGLQRQHPADYKTLIQGLQDINN